MSSDNTRIVKNSLILYFRLFVTSVLGLFTSRFVLQSLGASDFGLYSVVGGIVVMLNILNTSLTSSSYRYIAFEMGRGDVAAINKVFNMSLALHICLAFVIVLFSEIVGVYYVQNYLNVAPEKISDAVFVLRLSTFAVVFSVFTIPFQGLVVAVEKFSVPALIEVLGSLLRLSIAVLLMYYLGNRLRLYSVLTAAVIVLTAVIYISYCYKKHISIVRWKFQRDMAKYKEMVGFSGWMMIGACASMGKVQGAALIINIFFGTVINASFGVANQVNNIILTFAHNIGQAAIPQITKSYSRGNSERMIQIVCYVSKYTFFFMLLPSLPILLETDFILKVWLGQVPQYTSIFCQLMILNALLDCLGAGIPAAVQATGKIKYFQIVMSTTSLISLPIAYYLFKIGYPPYSILVAYISTSIINVVVRQILLKILINFDVKKFITISYVKILFVVLAVSPLFILKNIYDEGVTRFFVLSAIAVLWLLLAVYVVGIDKTERGIISYRIGRLRSRLFGKKVYE